MAGRNGGRSLVFMHPSASFSATIRVRIDNQPGAFARLAAAVGEAGGLLGAIDLVRVEKETKIRDVTVLAADDAHLSSIVDARPRGRGRRGRATSPTARSSLHLGGKIEVTPRVPLKTRDDLSMAYTPGRGARLPRDRRRPGQGLEPDDQAEHGGRRQRRHRRARPRRHRPRGGAARDGGQGGAVQGVRRRRRLPDLPRDDGHRTRSSRTVEAIAPVFGGINLEDISAPRCFEIERRLRESLDIPVFHDDQHGTAIVVLAALLNALRVVGKRIEDIRVVITGAGAAGIAVTRTLQRAGVIDVVGCDRERRALSRPARPDHASSSEFAETTNPRQPAGQRRRGARRRRRLHRPLRPRRDHRRGRARGWPTRAIVFAMANPTPEVDPGGDRGARRR